MNFKVLAAFTLAVSALRCAPSKDQVMDVNDDFDRVAVIIQSLSELEPPPTIYEVASPKHIPQSRKTSVKTSVSKPVLPVWQGRHLGPFKRTTVFSAFDISVDELSPSSFKVSIVSTEYCEEVQAKDISSRAVLFRRSLDDEKAFNIEVTNHKLDEKIALSIAVLKDGNLNYAFMPLLEGTGMVPTPR